MRFALALPLVFALGLAGRASAQTQIRPRFLIAFDTSGSMTVDLNDIPTYGDGISGLTRGLDTDCNGVADDSRMFVAKEALRNMIYAFGDIEFALARFPQFARADVLCPANGISITNQECNLMSGPFVGGIGDPTTNTGALVSVANCGAEWNGLPGMETPIDLIPMACRPGVGGRPAARLWTMGSPNACINYAGACPGTTFPGLYTFPNGDILVGFEGFGWPALTDNRPGMLKWIDNRETAFNANAVSGNFCDHATTGDCELRPNGNTPLGGLLRAAESYITPIRSADSVTCRPYNVILLTDGVETCAANPALPDHPYNVAQQLFETNNIRVYVVGMAIGGGGRTLLNEIARRGGTDVGAPGGDTAFFADDRFTLADGLADIVRDSLLIEECNGVDDDCDVAVDEGFVKYCNRPLGNAMQTLCTDPGERVCDGLDDNCNGLIDEGLLNRCGACGAVPAETCDVRDNDCDGFVDEGVCGGCSPEPEICDNENNDCDANTDENLMRPCGISLGECDPGTQICTGGAWGTCSGARGPSMELCDGLDNDCDGAIDNLTRPCGDSDGQCVAGTQRCIGPGTWSACEGSVDGTGEICDDLDNDCDGPIDEDLDMLGTCGEDEGECDPGVLACVDGVVTCSGGRTAVDELCDLLDNDCDGETDEGLPLGLPCGTDEGECDPGIYRCVAGVESCEGEVPGTDELCDGLDNDCDGEVDEGIGVGDECGDEEGLCERGRLQCIDGALACVGTVPGSPEVCDCEDNDCDGRIDEGADEGTLCPGDSACIDCQCAAECLTTEFGDTCPTGRFTRVVEETCYCVAERCNPVDCATETVEDDVTRCAPDDEDVGACVCKENRCTFACEGVACEDGTVCNPRDPRGVCVRDDCRGLGCSEGQLCDPESGVCQDDPCATTECREDQACRGGECERSCAATMCDTDEICEGGVCRTDRCAGVTCDANEVCDPESGDCAQNMCSGVRCDTGEVCEPVSGDCEVDPCLGLHCPAEQICVRGECALDDGGTDGGVPKVNRRVLAAGGGGCACDVTGTTSPRGPAGMLLVALAMALFALRRRKRLLCAFATALLASGCHVDPFCIDCEEQTPSDAGRDASDATNDARDRDATDPADADADACAEREACNSVDDDCDGRIDEEIDTENDPRNCGGCNRACEPVHAFPECVAGECTFTRCDVGFYDLDPDDPGCEYRCSKTADDDARCDLRDDDCDGEVDEDVDLENDLMNCGACGRTCRYARADASCEEGDCVLGDCESGFYDDDENEANGCEYACRPATPATEQCNARDDDCDGEVDEGNPTGGAACGTTEGECSAGVQTCVAGVLRCLGGTLPAAETCNTRDDDCDGDTDEVFDFTTDPVNCGSCGTRCSLAHATSRCASSMCMVVGCDAGYVDLDDDVPGCEYACDARGAEVCNGSDDDCDGRIDEAVVAPTSLCRTVGVCVGTVPACTDGAWTCNYTDSRYQEVENRCDLVDNDCDGATNEGFSMLTMPCTRGVGACQTSGTYRCTASGLGVECGAATPGAGSTEACDGEDDDCDGRIDEAIAPTSMPTVSYSLGGGATVRIMSYEASRPNATASSPGTLETAACSKSGVLPWTTVTWPEARAACCALNSGGACGSPSADGWRLCDAEDWELACRGTGNCTWAYSSACTMSSSLTCNGAERDSDPGMAGDQDELEATGSFAACNVASVYDLSGNAKEWTETEVAPGVYGIRGGSINNVEDGLQCTFDFTLGDATFAFPNTGFRCCYYDF